MANLLVDERDVKFVLYEQLDAENLCKAPVYSDFSRETFDMVLDAACKLAENELWPANRAGDESEVKLVDGAVRVPEAFHKVYELYRDGGWPLLSVDQELGGQGLPRVVYCAAMETFVAANLAFMGYPGLALGAARIIQRFGTEEQQRTYMDRMFTGEWGGTMCLTEPQAGSDVGALRTRARKNPDGTYSIVGSKIFITSGDQDLTENIVHMVLARVEGAPPGTGGISIFIVPKKRMENGNQVDNDVVPTAVEKKMGMHGSATCALNFGEKDACIGYLVGEENAGMRIMFTLINEARLAVGIQGQALASGAYMHALRYAQERFQGPHFSAMRDPHAPKIAIVEHPDVRRMIMWMKSLTEGMRALLFFTAYCVDRAAIAEGEDSSMYEGLVELLIPVCKAWCTDMSFKVTETAVQVHGGYGYCREYPVEQFLRDVKITSIYEGTNGIQALDLVGRKLGTRQGALFQRFVQFTGDVIDRVRGNPRLAGACDLFERARAAMIDASVYFAQKGMAGETTIPVLYATPYMELFGDVAVGRMLLWQAQIADEKLEAIFAKASADTPEKKTELLQSSKEAAFYRGKIASAQFFANTVLALAEGKAKSIMSGECCAIEMPKECFVR